MNMFKSSKVKTVEQYLHAVNSVNKDRFDTIIFLHKYIQKISPKFKPWFAYNMIGYGSIKYKNYKQELIDWPIIALANQKNYISLYVCAIEAGQYIAEHYKKDLGKVSVGKSCIRFKKLDDLELNILKKVLKLAAKSPGLIDSRSKLKS